jgi:hypothetical protein
MVTAALVSKEILQKRGPLAGRRAWAAWSDAAPGLDFPHATPRVRAGLVLRPVARRTLAPARKGPHARGAR